MHEKMTPFLVNMKPSSSILVNCLGTNFIRGTRGKFLLKTRSWNSRTGVSAIVTSIFLAVTEQGFRLFFNFSLRSAIICAFVRRWRFFCGDVISLLALLFRIDWSSCSASNKNSLGSNVGDDEWLLGDGVSRMQSSGKGLGVSSALSSEISGAIVNEVLFRWSVTMYELPLNGPCSSGGLMSDNICGCMFCIRLMFIFEDICWWSLNW